jgi:ABC-type proline/glycine betaine transport system permease subunit
VLSIQGCAVLQALTIQPYLEALHFAGFSLLGVMRLGVWRALVKTLALP